MTSIIEKQSDFDLILEKLTNNFFYSTVCHICKKIKSGLCSGCQMISYCSREHQRKHWPEHKDLCKAIQYVRETYKSETYKNEIPACEEPIMMEFLKEMVKGELKRGLKLYEVQMFKYSRMCLICYKQNELKYCSNCMAVWLCAQHKNNHDSNTCDLLKLCFKTDVLFQNETPFLIDACMKVPSYKKHFLNIKQFISIYGNIKDIQSELSPELLEIKLSAHLTKPLTVIHVIKLLMFRHILDYNRITYNRNRKEFVLHIIAAHISELLTLREWEILLHMFPNLKCLRLVLIGPDITFIKKQKTCCICNQQKNILLIEWHDESYADYVQQEDIFKIPDLVIRFHMDNFYDEYYKTLQSIWKSSLKHIAQLNCPFLLCYSRKNNNIDKIINTELGNTIKYRRYKNPYASLKPCRRMYDDDDDDLGYSVHYDNRFINVYKSLRP